MVFAAGVTSGIDGALRVAADLRGVPAAELIQLYIPQYAPEPPFNAETSETAPAAIVEATRKSVQAMTAQRIATAKRVFAKLEADSVVA